MAEAPSSDVEKPPPARAKTVPIIERRQQRNGPAQTEPSSAHGCRPCARGPALSGQDGGVTTSSPDTRTDVLIGQLARAELLVALDAAGVQLNAHARTLLDDVDLDEAAGRRLILTEITLAELGLGGGASLSQVFAGATRRGLGMCPVATAPYLRLAWTGQAASTDPVLSRGRAPDGAVTVGSTPLTDDEGYPKGFYLRVVDGVSWLRGYRCDDEHLWSPTDRFLFEQR